MCGFQETSPMKIAQFNTFPYGGAATAARRVHHELCKQHVDSQFFFHRNDKNAPGAPEFYQIEFEEPSYHGISGPFQKRSHKKRQKEVHRLYNEHIGIRAEGQETFSMAQLPHQTRLDWSQINADVAHLHWISFFADYPSFFQSIPNHVPIVWTLHDMNAFTGGCHYNNHCVRFKTGCGGCPQIENPGHRDVSAVSFQVKQRALKNKKIHVVAPSKWMQNLAMQSKIWPDATTFQTIRLGFDLKQFHPINKSEARAELGLKGDSTLIAFGAEDINNRRKGMQHLVSALRKLKTSKAVECLVFGSGDFDFGSDLPRCHSMGYVDSESKQAQIYSAADIVVVPSREDNQPQVGLEAMACGTPVIGFDAGGIPEYVLDGVTGLLAELTVDSDTSEQNLASKIDWLVENTASRKAMGENARQMMRKEFELGQQSQKYLSLYRNATQSRVLRAA
jgi:glycosyltransferase involved in cell wall biosynthesis